MNTKQIIAELRRSACEDADPWHKCKFQAWDAAHDFKLPSGEEMCDMRRDDLRTFYLLVAEAMESE